MRMLRRSEVGISNPTRRYMYVDVAPHFCSSLLLQPMIGPVLCLLLAKNRESSAFFILREGGPACNRVVLLGPGF